jgi:hypothetical protein
VTGPGHEIEHAPLVVVRGDASPDEVAALLAVLQGLSAARTPPPRRPRPEWSAPHRAVRIPVPPGPGAWRSSGLPR